MAAQPARRARDPRIEALRLAAILAIAVFHTFQPLFARTAAWVQLGDAAAAQAAAAAGDPAAAFALCPPAAGALGFINLLGAFGNCAFFAISGFFLIPAAASAAGRDSYWRDQARRCVRRAGTVLSSVLLYAVLALAVSAWVTPLPGVSLHETGWLLGGLEFIWVYLALIAATPVIGALWARCPHPVRLTALIVAAVYAVNAYIAFASPGEAERGLLEWRKLMSAASYLAAFLAGGALAWRREHGAKGGRTARARILPLVATAACAAVLELGLARPARRAPPPAPMPGARGRRDASRCEAHPISWASTSCSRCSTRCGAPPPTRRSPARSPQPCPRAPGRYASPRQPRGSSRACSSSSHCSPSTPPCTPPHGS